MNLLKQERLTPQQLEESLQRSIETKRARRLADQEFQQKSDQPQRDLKLRESLQHPSPKIRALAKDTLSLLKQRLREADTKAILAQDGRAHDMSTANRLRRLGIDPKTPWDEIPERLANDSPYPEVRELSRQINQENRAQARHQPTRGERLHAMLRSPSPEVRERAKRLASELLSAPAAPNTSNKGARMLRACLIWAAIVLAVLWALVVTRYELQPALDGTIVYKLDRWTGKTTLIVADEERPVKAGRR